VAAALNIPVISIFGPTQDFYSKPVGNKDVWVVNLSDEQIPCRPCDQIHCTNEIHQKCLAMIEVAHVLEKLETFGFSG
jgi:ADP-heptose:LPS heptosyltransferase